MIAPIKTMFECVACGRPTSKPAHIDWQEGGRGYEFLITRMGISKRLIPKGKKAKATMTKEIADLIHAAMIEYLKAKAGEETPAP